MRAQWQAPHWIITRRWEWGRASARQRIPQIRWCPSHRHRWHRCVCHRWWQCRRHRYRPLRHSSVWIIVVLDIRCISSWRAADAAQWMRHHTQCWPVILVIWTIRICANNNYATRKWQKWAVSLGPQYPIPAKLCQVAWATISPAVPHTIRWRFPHRWHSIATTITAWRRALPPCIRHICRRPSMTSTASRSICTNNTKWHRPCWRWSTMIVRGRCIHGRCIIMIRQRAHCHRASPPSICRWKWLLHKRHRQRRPHKQRNLHKRPHTNRRIFHRRPKRQSSICRRPT